MIWVQNAFDTLQTGAFQQAALSDKIHSGLRTLWFAHAQVSMDAFGERGYDLGSGILDLNHPFSPWNRIAYAKSKVLL